MAGEERCSSPFLLGPKMEFIEDIRSNIDDDDKFVVRFSAWEGPIEAMLELAKTQKIDLLQIDLLDLVAQFETVISKAMAMRLELAADWLVMASWMTFLKSKLLLRRTKSTDKPEMDENSLAFHLKRLDAMKSASEAFPKRLVLGRDWFGPGGSSQMLRVGNRLPVSLHDFLMAYPKPRTEALIEQPEVRKHFDVTSVDAAINRLSKEMPSENWTDLIRLIPKTEGLRLRSDIATSLIGSLELARQGRAEIRQDALMEPIYVRRLSND